MPVDKFRRQPTNKPDLLERFLFNPFREKPEPPKDKFKKDKREQAR